MSKYTLENIIYQHVLYGTGAIFDRDREPLIQPQDLQAAIDYAKDLLQSSEYQKQESSESTSEYAEGRDSVLQEVLQFYNATVVDGRFIDDLPTKPRAVAKRLGIELSDAAEAELKEAGNTVANRFGSRFDFAPTLSGGGKKIVAVVIAAVIVIRAEPKPYTVIVDSSGLIKV